MITTMIDKKPEERKRKLVTKHDEDIEVDGPSIPKKDKITTKDKASSIEDRFHEFDDISQDEKVLRSLGKVEKKKRKHKRKKKNQHKEKTNKITGSILKDKILCSNNESTSNRITKKRSPKEANRKEDRMQSSHSELCSDTIPNERDVLAPMKRNEKFKGNNKGNKLLGQSLKEKTPKHEGTSEFQQSIVIDSTSEEENIEISQQNKKIGETRISQVAPIKKKKKKEMKAKRNEMGLYTPEGVYQTDNHNSECGNKVEDKRNMRKKRKKKKKEKDKDVDIDDAVDKIEEDKTIKADKELKEKSKEVDFVFESSMMAKFEKEKGNILHGGVSRVNSLYAKGIPRHELLDRWTITSAQLRENNVKFAKGRWTNYELYILFRNIIAGMSMYDINNFKDFMLAGGNNNKTDVQRSQVFRDCAIDLLRPLSLVWSKLSEIYVIGSRQHPENRNKFYTPEESKRLLDLANKYNKDWKSISRDMDRSILSCRNKYIELKQRSQIQEKRKDKGFSKHQRFSPEEDRQLLYIVRNLKRENRLLPCGRIPWVIVAQKMGTRCQATCQRRYQVLLAKKDIVEKLSPAERYALVIKVLRLLISQNFEDLFDVDWEKLKACVGFKGHWLILKRQFTQFLDNNVGRDLTTNQQRLDYLIGNPSKRVIRSAKKLSTDNNNETKS